MPDLLRDHVRLPELARSIPETYELLRLRANEGRIPVERGPNGRVFVERGFALALSEHRSKLDSFQSALNTVKIMDDNANDAVSTTISELSAEWGFSRRRLKDAATNISRVAESNGAIETDERGLIALRRRLSNQTSTA